MAGAAARSYAVTLCGPIAPRLLDHIIVVLGAAARKQHAYIAKTRLAVLTDIGSTRFLGEHSLRQRRPAAPSRIPRQRLADRVMRMSQLSAIVPIVDLLERFPPRLQGAGPPRFKSEGAVVIIIKLPSQSLAVELQDMTEHIEVLVHIICALAIQIKAAELL